MWPRRDAGVREFDAVGRRDGVHQHEALGKVPQCRASRINGGGLALDTHPDHQHRLLASAPVTAMSRPVSSPVWAMICSTMLENRAVGDEPLAVG
ncbi:hypothetical protein TgHK011_005013 [Trichoderma gracile]|nr:hypothetical protein TgHK011_005013 [Trichoderma gracile]